MALERRHPRCLFAFCFHAPVPFPFDRAGGAQEYIPSLFITIDYGPYVAAVGAGCRNPDISERLENSKLA